MFVFYYCHKRGREVRLAREQAEAEGAEEEDDEEDGSSDDEEEDESEALQRQLEARLNQPEPAQVPLPDIKDDDIAEKKA